MLPHLTPDPRPTSGGFWVEEDFLWDVLPRLTPLSVYVYLLLGRYDHKAKYPTLAEIGLEAGVPPRAIREAVERLCRETLLNQSDVGRLFRDESTSL